MTTEILPSISIPVQGTALARVNSQPGDGEVAILFAPEDIFEPRPAEMRETLAPPEPPTGRQPARQPRPQFPVSTPGATDPFEEIELNPAGNKLPALQAFSIEVVTPRHAAADGTTLAAASRASVAAGHFFSSQGQAAAVMLKTTVMPLFSTCMKPLLNRAGRRNETR